MLKCKYQQILIKIERGKLSVFNFMHYAFCDGILFKTFKYCQNISKQHHIVLRCKVGRELHFEQNIFKYFLGFFFRSDSSGVHVIS